MSHPPSLAASATLSPVSSVSNVGKTGMIIPSPMTSMRRVIKMNKIAFLFSFIMQINNGTIVALLHICGKSLKS